MRKLTYVLIRYSVLIENTKSWVIANNDVDSYRAKLFEPVRLYKHLELFKTITLPSLENQTKKPDRSWLRVVIITSQDLPEWNKVELELLAEKYNWLDIDYLPTRGVSLERMLFEDLAKDNQDTLVATVRLDDDDALAANFFEKLGDYTNSENIGYGLSFGKGYAGFYDFAQNKYHKIVDYYYPKFSAGLVYFNLYKAEESEFEFNSIKTIFNAGGHSKIDRNIPTILDSREPMFIRTMHDQSDSVTSNKREIALMNHPSAVIDTVYERFPFLKGDDNSINFQFNNGVNKHYLTENKFLSFYLYNLEAATNDYIIISFNAAIAKRINKTAPFFSAREIAKESNVALLSFSDPVVDINEDLTLGWYLGSLNFIGLNFLICKIISFIVDDSGKRPILFGCSGGGFSAMIQSIYLSAMKIPHDLVVCNPQTNIFKYKQAAVDRFFDRIDESNNINSYDKRVKYLSNIGSKHEVKLSELESNYANIFYLQNINDSFHIENHLTPFLENIAFQKEVGGVSKDNFDLIFDDFGQDHAAPSRKYLIDFIQRNIFDSKVNVIATKFLKFVNANGKDEYDLEVYIFYNCIEVVLKTEDTEFELMIHLIIEEKLSGQSLIFNKNKLDGKFYYELKNESISVSVFQLDEGRKFSKRFKVL